MTVIMILLALGASVVVGLGTFSASLSFQEFFDDVSVEYMCMLAFCLYFFVGILMMRRVVDGIPAEKDQHKLLLYIIPIGAFIIWLSVGFPFLILQVITGLASWLAIYQTMVSWIRRFRRVAHR